MVNHMMVHTFKAVPLQCFLVSDETILPAWWPRSWTVRSRSCGGRAVRSGVAAAGRTWHLYPTRRRPRPPSIHDIEDLASVLPTRVYNISARAAVVIKIIWVYYLNISARAAVVIKIIWVYYLNISARAAVVIKIIWVYYLCS